MRVPDKDYKPPKRLMFALGGGLAAIMVGVTYYNWKAHQDDVAKGQATQAAAPASAPVQVNTSLTTGPASTRSVLDTLKHQNDVDLVMTRGWALVDKRDPQAAETAAEIFREALRDVDPGNAQFYNGLGRASLVAGKPADALDAFQKGLALDPTIADMQSGIGWAFWQLHQPYYAKQAWEAALKLNPKSPDAWSALAWIYLALGENKKARDGFALLIGPTTDKGSSFVMGLSLSRSDVQVDIKSIERYFPLPELKYLTTPPASVPPTHP